MNVVVVIHGQIAVNDFNHTMVTYYILREFSEFYSNLGKSLFHCFKRIHHLNQYAL